MRQDKPLWSHIWMQTGLCLEIYHTVTGDSPVEWTSCDSLDLRWWWCLLCPVLGSKD